MILEVLINARLELLIVKLIKLLEVSKEYDNNVL